MSKRTYHVLFGRPGGYMNWPGVYVTSNVTIRAFAISVFRQWFGRDPDDRRFSWASKGFMADFKDRRGNWVEVHQFNHGDPLNRIARDRFGNQLLLTARQSAA